MLKLLTFFSPFVVQTNEITLSMNILYIHCCMFFFSIVEVYHVFLHVSTEPDPIEKVTTTQPEHNVIGVTCRYSGHLNGPELPGAKFKAKLFLGDKYQDQKANSKCEFEFKGLSYSTAYTVKVCEILLLCFIRKSPLHSSYLFMLLKLMKEFSVFPGDCSQQQI